MKLRSDKKVPFLEAKCTRFTDSHSQTSGNKPKLVPNKTSSFPESRSESLRPCLVLRGIRCGQTQLGEKCDTTRWEAQYNEMEFKNTQLNDTPHPQER